MPPHQVSRAVPHFASALLFEDDERVCSLLRHTEWLTLDDLESLLRFFPKRRDVIVDHQRELALANAHERLQRLGISIAGDRPLLVAEPLEHRTSRVQADVEVPEILLSTREVHEADEHATTAHAVDA